MDAQQLAKHPLFAGAGEIGDVLTRLRARSERFAKGARILHAGERCMKMGILLSGSAEIVREDAGGDPVTVALVGAGELFAEAFACSGEPLTVSVTAREGAEVLWLDAAPLSGGNEPRLCANALRLFARKNVFLNERIRHLSRRSLEEKVLSYLCSARSFAGRETFSVPFDRQGLADYLGCDRSALSAVLSKLKKRGVLDFHKSTFRLL